MYIILTAVAIIVIILLYNKTRYKTGGLPSRDLELPSPKDKQPSESDSSSQ